ncbi:MAG: diguanylate cyclase domain-containing protein [Sulfuricaulis sp.]
MPQNVSANRSVSGIGKAGFSDSAELALPALDLNIFLESNKRMQRPGQAFTRGNQKPPIALSMEMVTRPNETYIIDGHKIHTAASVGVGVHPEDGKNFSELMKMADIAMYCIKGAMNTITITEQSDAGNGERQAPGPAVPENAVR